MEIIITSSSVVKIVKMSDTTAISTPDPTIHWFPHRQTMLPTIQECWASTLDHTPLPSVHCTLR